MNSKQELRLAYSKKRELYNEDYIKKSSMAIADLFFTTTFFDLATISSLHVYLPIKNKKEIDTYFIFNRLKESYPNIKLILSKSNFVDFTMELLEYDSNQLLIDNKYGIPEPIVGIPFSPEKLDLVLVPLLVVDKRGNRIGYGKGFYDRLLAKCRLDCLKIGISIEEPIENIIADSQDIALDYAITPKQIYKFSV